MSGGRPVLDDLWDLLVDLPEGEQEAALAGRLATTSPQRVVRFSRAAAEAAQALLRRAGASGSDADLLLALAVVAEGRGSYEAALADPDLLWRAEPSEFGEALMVLPGAAYERLTGLTLGWSDEHGLVDDPYLGGHAWFAFAGATSGPKGRLPGGYADWLEVLSHAVSQDPGLTDWWHGVRRVTDQGVEFAVIAGRIYGSKSGSTRLKQHPTWIEVEVHSRGRRDNPSALALALQDVSSGLLRLAGSRSDMQVVEDGLHRVGLSAVSLVLRAKLRAAVAGRTGTVRQR